MCIEIRKKLKDKLLMDNLDLEYFIKYYIFVELRIYW